MHETVKNIIRKRISKVEQLKELENLNHDIEIAKGIINGTYEYCSECDDYYLSKSFFTQPETKPGKICIYEDPINSGGNEYADGYIDIIYKVCPKGHKHEINRKERKK